MDPSDLGQLRRIVGVYGPNLILRNLTNICLRSNEWFIVYLDGLEKEELTIYSSLKALQLPEYVPDLNRD